MRGAKTALSIKFLLLASTAVFLGISEAKAQPAVVGNGSGLFSGETVGNVVTVGPNSGQARDSGTLLTAIPTLSANNTWTGTNLFIAPPAATTVSSASIGATAANGGILTGQGTSFDVYLENKNSSAALEVATGTTNVTVPGVLAVTGAATVGGALAVTGQLSSATGLPTISSGNCGSSTNGAVVAGSTNQSGQITIGSQSTTTCIINWSTTLGVSPEACVFYPTNATGATAATLGRTTAPSTTTGTLLGAVLASTNWAYLCL